MAGVAPSYKATDMSKFKVAIISASWHKEICDALVHGAHRALKAAHVAVDPVVHVPGSFEIGRAHV